MPGQITNPVILRLVDEIDQMVDYLKKYRGHKIAKLAKDLGISDKNLHGYRKGKRAIDFQKAEAMRDTLARLYKEDLTGFKLITRYQADNPLRVTGDPEGEEYKGLKSRVEDLENQVKELKAEVENLKAGPAQKNDPQ